MRIQWNAAITRWCFVKAQPIVKVFPETATLMHLSLCLVFLWSQEMRGCKGVWKWRMKKEREGSHFQCLPWYIYSQYDTLASHVSAGISRWLMHSSEEKPVKERWCARVNKNRMDGRRENERLVLAAHPKQIKGHPRSYLLFYSFICLIV